MFINFEKFKYCLLVIDISEILSSIFTLKNFYFPCINDKESNNKKY